MATPKNQNSLLVVDDEEGIRLQLKWALHNDYRVGLAADAPSAIEWVKHQPTDVVLLDIALSPTTDTAGLALLDELLSIDPTLKVIMITAHDSKQNALDAIDRGAYDFYSKPIDLVELQTIIKRALYIQTLERENRDLRLEMIKNQSSSLIGDSPQMQQVTDLIKRIAATGLTVLIQGESGTGKELAAREIHRLSGLEGKFVPINCGAIPATLMESELFGHEKGAFTDAHRQKRGKIEDADGGTLFLDEIAELPLDLQVKLLRFLQEREIQRVGSLKTLSIQTRVIAATNQDLEEAVDEGQFRNDLYFRLSEMTLWLPPLRDRGADILSLANSYLDRYRVEFDRPIKGFTPEAISAMMQFAWPGNVRELQNRIRRGIVITNSDRLSAIDLGLNTTSINQQSLSDAKDELECRFIETALSMHHGNISKAAEAIGVTRTTLYDLLKKHDINVDGFRKPASSN